MEAQAHSPSRPLRPIGRRLLRDEVYVTLRTAIVSGELAPGQPLRDADLAERMGLSRGPVRQALARLTAEGLVVSKPQSYTRVAPLDLRAVRDALDVVRALHETAVRAAVPRMSPDHLEAMRAANRRFADAVRAGAVDEAVEADDAFHDVPVAVCGNAALAETIHRYTPRLRRLERQRFGTLPGQRSIRRHDEFVAACAAGDVERAAEITRRIWAELAELADTDAAPNTPSGRPEPR
ncbi:GntR family transcriptional regulator [Marinitenerispora sediminis]|uniref:GntR family transcriptional regulator n=1 Tax=Marinitenerispora sediminis TaxID=1931232 RepID=A0A368SZH4_9ACTN|nr:GntR family transcriptional regulator [Marinitenerispora sediminis]RCV50262.1 GntR family transcriptional regulator [Marinitenerispora sediminis]RCV50471.1 GntR family transcriptional regulator [Marinitenerispora sediminis]RCV51143.1 GntR family transcriptional regulator [Marinitenerispora sediminis]